MQCQINKVQYEKLFTDDEQAARAYDALRIERREDSWQAIAGGKVLELNFPKESPAFLAEEGWTVVKAVRGHGPWPLVHGHAAASWLQRAEGAAAAAAAPPPPLPPPRRGRARVLC